MTYELYIETEVQDYLINYNHNREGLTSAFNRIQDFISKKNLNYAEINSAKTGLIFKIGNKIQ